jgi:hypothetical protein
MYCCVILTKFRKPYCPYFQCTLKEDEVNFSYALSLRNNFLVTDLTSDLEFVFVGSFEIFGVEWLRNPLFWNKTPRHWEGASRHSEVSHFFRLQAVRGQSILPARLKS